MKARRNLSVFTATSGKAAIHQQLQVIANNLANMNTSGFKAERLMFEKSAKPQQFTIGSISKELPQPSNLDTHEFTKAKGTYTDLSAGQLQMTGNPLDVAINGDGMFVIQTNEGERYTRSGEFTLDASNRLVTQEGHPVQGQGGDITINAGLMQVDDDGSIIVDGKLVSRFRIVSAQAEDLNRESAQKFKLIDGKSVQDVTEVKVQGGALEMSNVNAVKELTDMIFASRLFQALDKVGESSGKMTSSRNTVFGRDI